MNAAESGDGPDWTQRDQLILLGIFGVALALRLAHLFEVRVNDPFFAIPAVDGQLYQAQAEAIAGGDFAGEGVLFLGPFYPWFMGLVYALAGPSLFALKQLQAALGALDCVLVALLARLYFDRWTALLAAAFAAVYGMLVFYGGTVMIVNVMVPLILVSLILVTRALRDPTVMRWGVAGLAVGAAVLARQSMLLYALAIAAWIPYALRGSASWVGRGKMAGAFGGAVVLLILPFSVRNYVVGDDIVLLNSTGGINVYMGNNARANGAWMPPNFPMRADSPQAMQEAFRTVAKWETGLDMKPSAVSAYWQAKAADYVVENPVKWIELEVRKLLLYWNAREIWNNRSIDVSRGFSWVLRLPLLSFGVVAPLALLGIALSRRRWSDLFPLLAAVAASVATGMIAFVLSRYRMGAVSVLLIFAAYGVTSLVSMARAQRWGRVALAGGWLALFVFVVNRDMGGENLYMAYYNLGNKYRDLGRYEEAIASYDKSLAIHPDFLSTHNNLALAYEGAGREEDAIETWRHVYRRARDAKDSKRLARAARHLMELLDLPGEGPAKQEAKREEGD